jgi:polar amino acid transport system substrate-binding protein
VLKPIAALIFVVLLGCPLAIAGETIVFNTANDPPNSTDDHRGIGDRIMSEAFRRLDIPLVIEKMPSERSLINANQGIDDGNFARVEGMEALYPNLVRVPEAVTRFQFVVFTRNVEGAVTGWDSLKPYDVGIITGWKILEKNIVGTRSLTMVSDEAQLFNLLTAGRVDVVVYDRVQGLHFLEKEKIGGVRVLESPLAVRDMYPYVNKKHQVLAAKLAEELGKMRNDGTIDRIRSEVLSGEMKVPH